MGTGGGGGGDQPLFIGNHRGGATRPRDLGAGGNGHPGGGTGIGGAGKAALREGNNDGGGGGPEKQKTRLMGGSRPWFWREGSERRSGGGFAIGGGVGQKYGRGGTVAKKRNQTIAGSPRISCKGGWKIQPSFGAFGGIG